MTLFCESSLKYNFGTAVLEANLPLFASSNAVGQSILTKIQAREFWEVESTPIWYRQSGAYYRWISIKGKNTQRIIHTLRNKSLSMLFCGIPILESLYMQMGSLLGFLRRKYLSRETGMNPTNVSGGDIYLVALPTRNSCPSLQLSTPSPAGCV